MSRTLIEVLEVNDKYCSMLGTEFVAVTWVMCRNNLLEKNLQQWYIRNYPDRVEFLNSLTLEERTEFFECLKFME